MSEKDVHLGDSGSTDDEEDSEYEPSSTDSDDEDDQGKEHECEDSSKAASSEKTFDMEGFQRNVSLWKRTIGQNDKGIGEEATAKRLKSLEENKQDVTVPANTVAVSHSDLISSSVLQRRAPGGTVTPSPANKGRGGLSAGLALIGGKQKTNVLQASRMKWDSFKESSGLEHELESHNRSKDSFIEKQEFLLRSNYREYEHFKRRKTLNDK